MAIPLAIDRVRGQRSYGLVVGLAMLIAFHQLCSSARRWPTTTRSRSGSACGCRSRCSPPSRPGCSCAPATRVPDPRLGDLARPAVRPPRPPAATAGRGAARMNVLARYLNRMFLVRFLVVLFGIIGFATVIDLIDVGPELVQRTRRRPRRGPALFRAAAADHAVRADAAGGADRRPPRRGRPAAPPRARSSSGAPGCARCASCGCCCPPAWPWSWSSSPIDDFALPQATSELRLWGIGDYRHRRPRAEAGGFYWLRSGDDIVRLSANAIAPARSPTSRSSAAAPTASSPTIDAARPRHARRLAPARRRPLAVAERRSSACHARLAGSSRRRPVQLLARPRASSGCASCRTSSPPAARPAAREPT